MRGESVLVPVRARVANKRFAFFALAQSRVCYNPTIFSSAPRPRLALLSPRED